MLLRQVDRWLGFTKRLDRILPDRRNPLFIQHSQESLLNTSIVLMASLTASPGSPGRGQRRAPRRARLRPQTARPSPRETRLSIRVQTTTLATAWQPNI